jgi:hypothetical protein
MNNNNKSSKFAKLLNSRKEQYLFKDGALDQFKQILNDNHNFMHMDINIDRAPKYGRGIPRSQRILCIQALMDVYENWQHMAAKLKEDYYLKIWVFKPDFARSQVILGVKDRIAWYENLFETQTHTLEFPYIKDTKEFTWEFKKVMQSYGQEELAVFSKKYIANKFAAGRAREQENKELGKLTLIHTGDVWVGG